MNYYNEYDKKAASWLRELIKNKLIPNGNVDGRSIVDVRADEVREYTQCHFFAGIGGWSYALQLAGWPEDKPVWTGSCPCQPYSTAGKGKGADDERNLWPHFYRLIRECRPDTIFGEQVAAAIRHGWLDGVSTDLEKEGYTVGSIVLGAHSVNAPHIRQRLWWVGYTGQQSKGGESEGFNNKNWASEEAQIWTSEGNRPTDSITNGGVADSIEDRFWELERRSLLQICTDGKTRRIPVEPVFPSLDARLPDGVDLCGAESAFPLAGKIPGRVMLLKGYGNSICVPVASEFIMASMEVLNDL